MATPSNQDASPQGDHNIIVQAMGDGITVSVGLPWLELAPWRLRMRTHLKRDVDILNPAFRAVPLTGREGDLEFLLDWLNGDQIAVTALVGRGGSGKTARAGTLAAGAGGLGRGVSERGRGGTLRPPAKPV